MCEPLTLEQALYDRADLATLETILREMSRHNLWEVVDSITTSDNYKLKMTLAKAILQTRPATNEEAELWFNIENIVYPIFGFLQDVPGNYAEMTSLARIIFQYTQRNPESKPAIITIIEAAHNEIDFYGDDTEPYSEFGIYAEIAPIKMKPKQDYCEAT